MWPCNLSLLTTTTPLPLLCPSHTTGFGFGSGFFILFRVNSARCALACVWVSHMYLCMYRPRGKHFFSLSSIPTHTHLLSIFIHHKKLRAHPRRGPRGRIRPRPMELPGRGPFSFVSSRMSAYVSMYLCMCVCGKMKTGSSAMIDESRSNTRHINPQHRPTSTPLPLTNRYTSRCSPFSWAI